MDVIFEYSPLYVSYFRNIFIVIYNMDHAQSRIRQSTFGEKRDSIKGGSLERPIMVLRSLYQPAILFSLTNQSPSRRTQ